MVLHFENGHTIPRREDGGEGMLVLGGVGRDADRDLDGREKGMEEGVGEAAGWCRCNKGHPRPVPPWPFFYPAATRTINISVSSTALRVLQRCSRPLWDGI